MPKAPSEKSMSFDSRRSSLPATSSATSVSITCGPCRQKKIKCDSSKPTCMNCSKNPSECYYAVRQKPGLKPGSLDAAKRFDMLEDRMREYEERLSHQEARLSQIPFAGPSFSYDRSTPLSDPLLSAGPSNTFNPPLPPGSTPLVNALASTLHNPPSTSNPFPTDPSPGSGGAPFDPASFNLSASPGIGMASPSSFLDPQILPPDDIVRDLLSLFFTHIHPWAPILSPTMPDFKPPWNIVHHAIVAVTLRLSKDPRIATTKDLLKQRAKQQVLAHAIESTSISSVQALALLALDLIGSEQGPSSWGILALLTRSAVHLGLAKEEDNSSWAGPAPIPGLSRTSIIPPPANWHEDESRRRLFWLIYCLDRYACVATGWDFALPDSDIKRRLPCTDQRWALGEWFQAPQFQSWLVRDGYPLDMTVVSPMAFLVEALDLLGRAHTLQSQPLEPGDLRAVEGRKEVTLQLTAAAKRWMAGIPIDSIEQTSMRLMIHAAHYSTLLKLNGNYAYPALSNGEAKEPYVTTCLNSAHAMAAIADRARGVGWANASSPVFIWGCWVAARVLFVHSFLNHHTQPDEDFNIIVSCLREQAEYWALANQYVKLLERAKRKWLNSLSGAGTSTSLPDAIHVLLDLRRTAYSAVNTNTQETPHVSPPDPDLSHLPAWAVQPGLGDLYSWFDLPAGLFQSDTM
ncbi:hypothetical protein IAU59_006150 [Kwoniella sp. CBS 9459]